MVVAPALQGAKQMIQTVTSLDEVQGLKITKKDMSDDLFLLLVCFFEQC